jgi:hypothetical protein
LEAFEVKFISKEVQRLWFRQSTDFLDELLPENLLFSRLVKERYFWLEVIILELLSSL